MNPWCAGKIGDRPLNRLMNAFGEIVRHRFPCNDTD
jgi:hypothetical protein